MGALLAPEDEALDSSLVPLSRREARLLLELGELWLELGHPDRARRVLEAVAALLPASAVPRLALGRVAFARGEWNEALRSARQARRLAPDDALARVQEGEALLFQTRTREAVEALDGAMALDPEGPSGRLAQALLQAIDLGLDRAIGDRRNPCPSTV